jgi:nicotinamidase/pyrazinamidase
VAIGPQVSGKGMISRKHILWEVDVQRDFMSPQGKLYVPGAEKLLPNIRRLTDLARQDRAFLVSHGDFHSLDDPEFKTFPPHCVKGTAGADLLPEALADRVMRVPNAASAHLPNDLFQYQQIVLEKSTLDVFESLHADAVLKKLPAEANFFVFGVATDYCVKLAAEGLLKRGMCIALVQDAMAGINAQDVQDLLAKLQQNGARLLTTDQALKELDAP